jgi:hypothetical protein
LEPVPRTLKNPIFCRVLGTGSGKNPKFKKGFQNRFLGTLNFEKGSGLIGPGTGSGTLKNPRFYRVLGTGSGRNPKFEKRFQNRFLGTLNFKKGSRTGSLEL